MTTSLFDNEKSVIIAAQAVLAAHPDDALAGHFEALLEHYRKLYRQSHMLMRQGDRMQHKLTGLNESLARNEEKYRNIFENVAQGIFRATACGRFVDANPAMAAILGYPDPQTLMQEIHDIANQVYVHPAKRDALLQTLEFQGHVRDYSLQLKRRDGQAIWIDLNARAVYSDDRLLEVEGLLADVTEKLSILKKFKELATLDPLTGLYNRRSFLELCQLEFTKARREDTPLALVFFDLDHFKLVNDTYGHDAGDNVLRALSRLSASLLRKRDCLGRLGGEEFAVLLPGTNLAGARCLAEKLRKAFEASKTQTTKHVITVTASFGLAEIAQDMSEMKQLLKQADVALYRAKNTGRNRVDSFP